MIGFAADMYVSYGLIIPLALLDLFTLYLTIRPYDKQALTNRKAYLAISHYFVNGAAFLIPFYLINAHWPLPYHVGDFANEILSLQLPCAVQGLVFFFFFNTVEKAHKQAEESVEYTLAFPPCPDEECSYSKNTLN